MWQIVAILCASGPVPADAPDVTLAALVAASLEGRPELAEIASQTRAARERVPQVSAFPDPMLQVGVQNDSFTTWQVGSMQTSWVSFMASQTFLFPGKRSLREAVAQRDVELTVLSAERVRLSTIAQVRRQYLALQLVRAQQGLLEQRLALVNRLVDVARLRLQSGEASQADVLRAQVELARTKQRQVLLARDAALATQALNRLSGKPLDVEVQASPLPAMPEPLREAEVLAFTLEHSPEVLSAKARGAQASGARELSRRAALPDLTVSAGVMVRGPLEPMWTLSVGVPVPVFSAGREARSGDEASALGAAAAHSVEALAQGLTLATHQRAVSLEALRAVADSFANGLLASSAAAAESTLNSYSAGRAGFSAVLEASAESLSEREAELDVRAQAWRLVIDQDSLQAEVTP
jgi:outer membrane protein, heavy metal efflux system